MGTLHCSDQRPATVVLAPLSPLFFLDLALFSLFVLFCPPFLHDAPQLPCSCLLRSPEARAGTATVNDACCMCRGPAVNGGGKGV